MVVVLWALLLSPPSFSGPIADTFREGVFGVAWGATAKDLEANFPSGKWHDVPGGLRYYTVRDARTILGIERKRKNDITFGLSSAGHLSSVVIAFPSDPETYASLTSRAKEQFGLLRQLRTPRTKKTRPCRSRRSRPCGQTMTASMSAS